MTDKERARRARYDASDKGRARHERYNDSPKGQDRRYRYECSERGRRARAIYESFVRSSLRSVARWESFARESLEARDQVQVGGWRPITHAGDLAHLEEAKARHADRLASAKKK